MRGASFHSWPDSFRLTSSRKTSTRMIVVDPWLIDSDPDRRRAVIGCPHSLRHPKRLGAALGARMKPVSLTDFELVFCIHHWIRIPHTREFISMHSF